MSIELIPFSSLPSLTLSGAAGLIVPEPIARAGESAARRYLEFFTANIRNPNTRAAYGVAAERFFLWCDRHGFALEQLEPMHLAAYVEALGRELAAPSVKQHLAAIRVLFDWLVIGQVVRHNPAAAVRGPKYVIKRGKTPVLSTEEARKLLDSLPLDNLIGLRDRALIGVMVYTFARVSAVLAMRVGDFYLQGPAGLGNGLSTGVFQSTRPVWAATLASHGPSQRSLQFEFTRPVWAATEMCLRLSLIERVSIHAARVGRDASCGRARSIPGVSIHAARVGRDGQICEAMMAFTSFNPRGPCGPRRFQSKSPLKGHLRFNPRGPCGPRPVLPQPVEQRGTQFQSTRPVWAATAPRPP